MKFRTEVEPPEPMKGLEVPPEVVQELDGGKRPRGPRHLVRALDADSAARAAYDRLTVGQRKQLVRTIESAKKPDSRHPDDSLRARREAGWCRRP